MTKVDEIAYKPNENDDMDDAHSDPYDASDDEVNDENVNTIVSKRFCKKPVQRKAKKLKREYNCSKCARIFTDKSELEKHCMNPEDCEGQDANSTYVLETKKKYNDALHRLEYQLQKNQLTIEPIEAMERCAQILYNMNAMDFTKFSHIQLQMNDFRNIVYGDDFME